MDGTGEHVDLWLTRCLQMFGGGEVSGGHLLGSMLSAGELCDDPA